MAATRRGGAGDDLVDRRRGQTAWGGQHRPGARLRGQAVRGRMGQGRPGR
jgi:hypothetical protein